MQQSRHEKIERKKGHMGEGTKIEKHDTVLQPR